jgi:hypothetical protein
LEHFLKRHAWIVDLGLLILAVTVVIIATIDLDPSTTLLDIFAVLLTIAGMIIIATSFQVDSHKKIILTLGITAIIIGVSLGAAHQPSKRQSVVLAYSKTENNCQLLIQPDDGVISTNGAGEWHIIILSFRTQEEYVAKIQEVTKNNQLENCTQITSS